MVVVKRPPSPTTSPRSTSASRSSSRRQRATGVGNHNVRNVLALSLMGVVVLFGLIYLFFFAG
jgi:hypothetical protein